MLERRRRGKGFGVVGDGEEDLGEEENLVGIGRDADDLELGEGIGSRLGGGDGTQESGIINSGITAPRITTTTLDEEIDNWDENAVDNWDEEEPAGDSADGEGPKTPSASSAGEVESDIAVRRDVE